MRVLVAGFGNVLRGDDGFGVEVVRAFEALPPPDGVRVVEVGIGGIHLVQDLLRRDVDVLLVVDAVEVERPPGTVVTLAPEISDLSELPTMHRRDALADMHYATPDRALLFARELGVLPDTALIVGCQPVDADRLGEGLSPQVAAAVDTAVAELSRLVDELG